MEFPVRCSKAPYHQLINNNLQYVCVVHHAEVEESPKSGKCPLLSPLSLQLVPKIFQTIDQLLSSQLPANCWKNTFTIFYLNNWQKGNYSQWIRILPQKSTVTTLNSKFQNILQYLVLRCLLFSMTHVKPLIVFPILLPRLHKPALMSSKPLVSGIAYLHALYADAHI